MVAIKKIKSVQIHIQKHVHSCRYLPYSNSVDLGGRGDLASHLLEWPLVWYVYHQISFYFVLYTSRCRCGPYLITKLCEMNE